MNDLTNVGEYLYLMGGKLYSLDSPSRYGISLNSSDENIGNLSIVLDDTFKPPLDSRILAITNIIKIRNFLDEYLCRVNKK